MSAPVETDEAVTGPPPGRTGVQAGTVTMLVSGFAALLLLAVVGLAPVPYVISRPGPVYDTLAEVGGEPLIDIRGAPTYPTEGSLDLTTVYTLGGPGREVDVVRVLQAWLDPSQAVLLEKQVYPPGQTEEEADQVAAQQMTSSQENAAAAALNELGIAVPTTLTVTGFSPGADAAEELAAGDVITAVAGDRVTDLPRLRDRLQDVEPGEAVEVTVQRDGAPREVEVTTLAGPRGETLLGVLIDPAYDFPFEVTIQLQDVAGPSAGLMFALAIVDKLTPGAMTGGAQIAGTGTIDSSGEVGPISGIRQKLVAASRAGTRYFLAPAENCRQVVGGVPQGLRVVRVSTLTEARTAVEAIAADRAGGLPSCTGSSR